MGLLQPLRKTAKQILRKRGVQVKKQLPWLMHHPEHLLALNIDFVIAHFLLNRSGKDKVRFVQIGAFDGVSGDPIHQYIRKFGWTGALVEPQKFYFEKLKKNYEGVDGLKFFNVAVSTKKEERILYTVDDPETSGTDVGPGQLASFSLENIMMHQKYIPDLKSRVREEKVECLRFEDLLTETNMQGVDLVQIDVEGFDYEILKMIDLDKLRPSILRFEHKHLSRADQESAIKLLVSKGYKIAREKSDTTGYLLP